MFLYLWVRGCPRVSAIQEYLSTYLTESPSIYEFQVKLKPNTEARLQATKHLKEIYVKVAPASITPEMRDTNSSLSSMLDSASGLDDTFIEIKISSQGKKRKTFLGDVPFIKSLVANHAAKKAQIRGSEEEKGELELIDLLEDRELKVFTKIPLSKKGKRCSQDDRFIYLEKAYIHWKPLLSGQII